MLPAHGAGRKCGAAVPGPPRANDCECFFELGGGDLLPAPTRQEHEPPRPVEAESLEAPEPAPPRVVAGVRVGYAVRFDRELNLRAFDKRGQNLAGDVRVNSVARVKIYRQPSGRLVQELETLNPFDKQWTKEARAVKQTLRRRLPGCLELSEAVGGGLDNSTR